MSVFPEGSRKQLNRSGSPLQGSFTQVLGRSITILGESTITLQRKNAQRIFKIFFSF